MTSEVKQALPPFLLTKANGDKQSFRTRAADRNFGDALAAAKAGKQNASGKHAADAEPRWPRFGTKLDAAIDRTSGLSPNLSLKVAEPQPGESEAAQEEDFANAEQKSEDADAVSLSLPGIHIPPVQARRMPDGEKNAPTNAPGGESDIATSVDGSDDRRGAIPVGDEGKSRDRPRDNVSSSPAMAIAQADARPAAVTPEQSPKPQMAGPLAEPAVDYAKGNAAVDPDRGHTDPAKVAPRATVLSEQNIPAPMSSTTLVLVDSIASSGALIPVADRPAVDAIQALIAPAPAQSLKIQLHPAELGMVTATLRFAGEQLSIELKVENKEAYQRLSVDSETIVKSLRGLGYDIDRVTVLQPSIAVNTPARADGSAAIPSQTGRGSEQLGSGTTGGGSAGTGGQQPGGDGANARQGGQKNSASSMDRGAGGGIYI